MLILSACLGAGLAAAETPAAIYLSAAYASGSQTGGILEAIEACHRDGHPSCHIEQSGDITISSPQIVDLSAGGTGSFPVEIDGSGHTISCTNSQGTCLTFDGGLKGLPGPGNGHTRQFIWRNFLVDGTGSQGSGVLLTNLTAGPIVQGRVQFFAAAQAVALTLSNVEDSEVIVTLFGDFSSLLLRHAANNNEILAWIDAGGDPKRKDPSGVALQIASRSPSVIGSAGNTFRGLVQSNWGTRTVILGSDSGRNTFQNLWFENNGDQTAATRLVTFQPEAGHYVLSTRFASCFIGGGAWGKLGSIFSTALAPTLAYVAMEDNYTIGYAAFADSSLAARGVFLGINEIDTMPGAQAFYGTSSSHTGVKTPGLILSGPAPAAPGEVGLGGTVVSAKFCGSQPGVLGCLVVNIDGKTHYVPYW
jgi:hypothetical protein